MMYYMMKPGIRLTGLSAKAAANCIDPWPRSTVLVVLVAARGRPAHRRGRAMAATRTSSPSAASRRPSGNSPNSPAAIVPVWRRLSQPKLEHWPDRGRSVAGIRPRLGCGTNSREQGTRKGLDPSKSSRPRRASAIPPDRLAVRATIDRISLAIDEARFVPCSETACS
jgi:hypothetical protein